MKRYDLLEFRRHVGLEDQYLIIMNLSLAVLSLLLGVHHYHLGRSLLIYDPLTHLDSTKIDYI